MSDLQWEADGAEYWAIADLKTAPFSKVQFSIKTYLVALLLHESF